MNSAKYVWFDSKGEGRNLHGMFRRSFEVTGAVRKAQLHLFADSVYELVVNGQRVNFGPARFDPRAPEYDSYDLTPYLCEGRNVIAVLVNHFGCIVYRAMPARAGLIAWGEVELEGGSPIALESGSTWKAKCSEAYQDFAPKQSFSLEPMEVFNQKNEPAGWQTVDFDDSKWADAVTLKKQDTWGALSARSIPFMSGEEVSPERVIHLSPLTCHEDIYSFQIPAHYWYEFEFEPARRKEFKAVLFYTWIYSPETQTVPAGLFWGEHWLNGEPLNDKKRSAEASLRVDHSLRLKKGWNSFFGKIEPYFDTVDFYFGLPAGKGLILNADQDLTGKVVFRRTGVLRTEEYEALGGGSALPFVANNLPQVSCGWIDVTAEETANNPARERDWDRFGADCSIPSPSELNGFVFSKKQFPDGFALELDLGAMRLLKLEIDIEGVEGASVDFAFSEYLNGGDRVKLFPSHTYQSAARAQCARSRLIWSPMQPHGMRYLVLTVRNPSHDIKLNRLTLRSAEYPVKETGRFQCSDPVLNEIWALCKRTEMTNMEDAYVDCPGRERGMYIHDTIIQYHNNLALFGDQKLMRRCLKLYGMSNAPDGKFRACYPLDKDYTIADFSLNMVEGFWHYVQQTGDLSVVRGCWDNIVANLNWFNDLSDEREDGLLDADWDRRRGIKSFFNGFHGDNQSGMRRDGISAVFSSMYLSALNAGAQLADQMEDSVVAADCRLRYDQVKKSIHRHCWDEVRGSYADTVEKKEFFPHAAIMAVRAGVPDPAQTQALREFMKRSVGSLFVNGVDPNDGPVVSPHFCFYLFEALYRLDLPELTEKLIREGWSWMIRLGTRTCTEFFSERGSWCHAWSASPAYYLSKHALGVHLSENPQSDDVEIRVQSGSLDWAEGTYPHPKGPIHIKWHMEDGKRIFDRIDVPPNVRVIQCEEPASFGAIEITEGSTNALFVDSIEIANSLDDSDDDGLPDGWEELYYGDLDANPGDLSSNGVNTVVEAYIAGLDPTDPNDVFLITDLRPLTSKSILEWTAASGRVYAVYWTSNLLNGFGAPWETNLTGGVFTDTTHSAEEKGFYKIDVELE